MGYDDSDAFQDEKEVGSPTSASAPATHFLVTRVLRAIVPRKWLYSEELPLPSSKPPSKALWILSDWFFYSSSFSLLWASATGRTLREDDFAPLSSGFSVDSRLAIFKSALRRFQGGESSKDDEGKGKPVAGSKIPLLRALVLVFKKPILKALGLQFIAMAALLCQVLIYKALISYLIPLYHQPAGTRANTFGEGVGIVVGAAAGAFFSSVLRARAIYAMDIVAAEARTLLSSALASQALVLSTHASRETDARQTHDEEEEELASGWSSATLLNLANTDTERVQLAIHFINEIWSPLVFGPLVGGLSFWLVGWPGWAALGFLFLCLSLLIPLVGILYRLRKRINIETESRVNIVNDLISGVQLLKSFCWEDIYIELVRTVRAQETKLNQKRVTLNAITTLTANQAGRLPPLLAIGLYSISHTLQLDQTPALLCQVFLFYVLSENMYLLPEGVLACADGWQSIRRLESYLCSTEYTSKRKLLYPEREGNVEEDEKRAAFTNVVDGDIEMQDAEFSWTEQDISSQFQLSPMSFNVQKKELFAITGPTSAGKSTLVEGIAGHLRLRRGTASCSGPIVFAATKPWIYSATIRDNILFGLEYHEQQYYSTITSCMLRQDLDKFPSGDLTSLGEKGINLSGGQRARIGLARAVYTSLLTFQGGDEGNTGIIVLDDPFSALDAATASAVFENVVMGKLSNFTRVLVTHQVEFLGRCDRVAWMDAGRIHSLAPFQTLMESDPLFKAFIGEKKQLRSDDSGSEDDDLYKVQTTGVQGENFIQDEERHSHHVSWKIITSYIELASTWPFLILLAIVYLASQVGNLLYQLTLVWWTSQTYNFPQDKWPIVIAAIIVIQALLWNIAQNGTQYPLTRYSEKLSNDATRAVLKAPLSFFATNPLGRILNRFTQDVNTTDTVLPQFTWLTAILFCHATNVLAFTIYYVHLVAAVFVPWLMTSLSFVLFYRPTPLNIKRVESLKASELISHISEIVIGASTIQSFPAAEKAFIEKLYYRVDNLNRIRFKSMSVHAWIAIQASISSAVFFILVGILAIRLRHSLQPSLIGAILITCFDLQRLTQNMLETMAEVQRGLNCVERLHYYAHGIDQERASRSSSRKAEWPTSGSIDFRAVDMRYREDLPLALHNVNLDIKSGEKIGVVGRTGAGKSSLYLLLMGFVDPCQGSLLIDGVDISTLGLHDLREEIAIIPQEPTLFAGTVRSNLDPLKKYSDEYLIQALKQTGLTTLLNDTESRPSSDEKHLLQHQPQSLQRQQLTNLHLPSKIAPGGSNLSVGQRQLLSLARALVRDTKILLIDEATASVDYQTDTKIQKMLRQEFGHRTVIAIAHRITTVLGYDRIVVMDEGRVVEVDTPRRLWEKKEGGIFRELCDRAEIDEGAFGDK